MQELKNKIRSNIEEELETLEDNLENFETDYFE